MPVPYSGSVFWSNISTMPSRMLTDPISCEPFSLGSSTTSEQGVLCPFATLSDAIPAFM
uniref:Uncharacterized protein n=1 Tax=Arundo donax TaxID=35708 RepID=A0A0A9EGQ6_ARUDO